MKIILYQIKCAELALVENAGINTQQKGHENHPTPDKNVQNSRWLQMQALTPQEKRTCIAFLPFIQPSNNQRRKFQEWLANPSLSN